MYQDVFFFCRYVYPDFLPSTNWKHRDRIREILERKDMYRRRLVMEIPEFYVGMLILLWLGDVWGRPTMTNHKKKKKKNFFYHKKLIGFSWKTEQNY